MPNLNLPGKIARDSYTFLMKSLEKLDPIIREPLTSTDWPRDMPVITGGGLVESIASVDVTYGSAGRIMDNLINTNTTEVPVIQADMTKSVARCFNYAEYMAFSVLESEKMRNVGYDPDMFLKKGIRLHCDKTIDRNIYLGFTKVNSTGLCNNASVTRVSADPHTVGGTDTEWANKTADEILHDINYCLTTVWEDNDTARDGLPNHILIPPQQYGLLVSKKVSDDANMSIMEYVLKNNICAMQGVELIISPSKFLCYAGSGATDRMVVYCNDPDRICFNLTQPLRRLDTEHSNMFIKIPYIAQFSEVRFLYPSTVMYMDGI